MESNLQVKSLFTFFVGGPRYLVHYDNKRRQSSTESTSSMKFSDTNISRSRKKQRGGRISITCITTSVVGIFVLYISLVLTKFGDYHQVSSNNGNSSSSSSSSKYGDSIKIRHGSFSRRNNIATATTAPQQETAIHQSSQEQQNREPTIQDFCGLCQWKGQSFNCNTRITWLVKTKKQASIEAAKLVELLYCTKYNGCGNTNNSSSNYCTISSQVSFTSHYITTTHT